VDTALTLVAVWGVLALLLFWPAFGAAWRHGLALVFSAAGLAFLLLGLSSEGLRESSTVRSFLIGPLYVGGQTSASAGLPFYVLTAACLALGTVGLALVEAAVERLRRHWLALAIAVSLFVTVVRFLLEKAAAPQSWTFAVGVTWLAPLVGAFFAYSVRRQGAGVRVLLGALVTYALAVRGAVAVLMVLATRLRLGTHYDMSPLVDVVNPMTGTRYALATGSFEQLLNLVVVPQLVFWPGATVLMGLVGAGLLRLAWLGRPGPWPPTAAAEP